MAVPRSLEDLIGLVRELCREPRECEWLEWKKTKSEFQEIGEYMSALSNSAALSGRTFGYLVWGVEDGTREIVGTKFSPASDKIGNEELENWLLRLLSPQIDFHFKEIACDPGLRSGRGPQDNEICSLLGLIPVSGRGTFYLMGT